MDNESNSRNLSLVCPSCGGKMKLVADGKKAECPYCGHEMFIGTVDLAQKEYERRIGEARAEEEISNLKRRRRIRGWFIALGVIAGICMVCVLLPGSAMHTLVFPRTVDPFTAVYVEFSGMSGEGRAELQISGSKMEEYADASHFEVVPQTGLSNGDTVTVKAKTAPGWRFDPSEKQFTVEGLTVWVLHTNQISGDNLAAIHSNTERLIQKDWREIIDSSLAREMSYTPYRMYLFIAGDDSAYERNVLYDTYEVKVTREDGSIFTSYEACRYADLKIPGDGVMTADYGSLMGFNFGYTQGFSYSHSFSGWTDAAEMEADLRYAREGYRLTD